MESFLVYNISKQKMLNTEDNIHTARYA